MAPRPVDDCSDYKVEASEDGQDRPLVGFTTQRSKYTRALKRGRHFGYRKGERRGLEHTFWSQTKLQVLALLHLCSVCPGTATSLWVPVSLVTRIEEAIMCGGCQWRLMEITNIYL